MAVNYRGIFTLEKVGLKLPQEIMTLNYHHIFIASAPGPIVAKLFTMLIFEYSL
jgi:hypothetical protein